MAAAGGRVAGNKRSRLARRWIREALDRRSLGEVVYCRVADAGWRELIEWALEERAAGPVVIDLDPAAEGAVLLGSAATLALHPAGCDWFPAAEV